MKVIPQHLKLYYKWIALQDIPVHILLLEAKADEEIARLFFPPIRHALFLLEKMKSYFEKAKAEKHASLDLLKNMSEL